MPETRSNTAVVLSGGGAYGAYEVGILKALCNGLSPATNGTPLNPGILTGTSVGNFNAAVMAMYPDDGGEAVRRLEQVWTSEIADCGSGRGNGIYRIRGNPPGYVNPPPGLHPLESLVRAARDAAYLGSQWGQRAARFFTSRGSLTSRAFALIDLSSFICVDPMHEMLKRVLDVRAIRNSPKILRTVATNWHTGATRVFTNTDITDEWGRHAILASASIPGVFPPVRVGRELYVDGGVVMNTPLCYALDAGATELHVISLDPDVRSIPLEPLENTFDVFDRVYTAMLAAKIEQDIETARSINHGLEMLERLAAGEEPDKSAEKNLLRIAGKICERMKEDGNYQVLTIHRYRPAESLGGALAILNFGLAAVREMIARGVEDATNHDCHKNGCVIPHKAKQPKKAMAAGAETNAAGSHRESAQAP